MRKILCILLVALFGVTTAFAQSSVTVTFLCQTQDGGYLQPDSICIENLTRNWSETIYYPDTVYILNVGTDVPNLPNDNGMRIMPNPFDGTTRVNIQSPKTENVKMTIADINGRVCAEYTGLLQEGGNLFSISLTTPQTYILSVQTSSGIRSLKMENVGLSGANRIAYDGSTGDDIPMIQLKSSSSHAFELGDNMRYVGYATQSDSTLTSIPVERNQVADETITLTLGNLTHLNSCEVVNIHANETGNNNRITNVEDHEGNSYQVVQVGSQCWLKENMRCTTSPTSGANIVQNPAGMMSYTEKQAYYYDNDPANANDGYGLLYNWTAAMDGDTVEGGRGICPEGWHIPTDAEWTTLMNTAVNIYQPDVTPSPAFGSSINIREGENTNIVQLLNDLSDFLDTLEYYYQNGLITLEDYTVAQEEINTNTLLNATGFSALPSGCYYIEFSGRDYVNTSNTNIFFWTSSTHEFYFDDAYFKMWTYLPIETGIYRYVLGKCLGCSVRCLRD